ncbi:hypothetical protein KDH_44790 [Dictyobacter sp. S3.2.2.5]|uniref:Uncharacterized protein n=1 Tax=Dictyobacter halimunensis TaxID=3026934 RepID=A0ABQ6FVH4_9CHLR|nr:hypothetical protein KDH_44790 [Dictyobacter sp. S3.2.2.5]
MSIHYVLRGKTQVQDVEREGTLSDEQLVGVKISQDTALINVVIRTLRTQGIEAEWQECVLDGDAAGTRIYTFYKKRWTQQKTR